MNKEIPIQNIVGKIKWSAYINSNIQLILYPVNLKQMFFKDLWQFLQCLIIQASSSRRRFINYQPYGISTNENHKENIPKMYPGKIKIIFSHTDIKNCYFKVYRTVDFKWMVYV